MSEEITTFVANDQTWAEYKVKFEKEYKDQEEEAYRRSRWEESIKQINEHNERFKNGEETYSLAVTVFTDGFRPPYKC